MLLPCSFHTPALGFAGKYSKNELVEYYSETHGEWCFGKQTARFVKLMSLCYTRTKIWWVIFPHTASKKCEAQVTCNSDSKQWWWLLGRNGEVDGMMLAEADLQCQQCLSGRVQLNVKPGVWISLEVSCASTCVTCCFLFCFSLESLKLQERLRKIMKDVELAWKLQGLFFFARFSVVMLPLAARFRVQKCGHDILQGPSSFVVENFA